MGDDKKKPEKPKWVKRMDNKTRERARQIDNTFSGGKSSKVTRAMRRLIGDDPRPHD